MRVQITPGGEAQDDDAVAKMPAVFVLKQSCQSASVVRARLRDIVRQEVCSHNVAKFQTGANRIEPCENATRCFRNVILNPIWLLSLAHSRIRCEKLAR